MKNRQQIHPADKIGRIQSLYVVPLPYIRVNGGGGGYVLQVIWEAFKPVEPEEVDRALSAATMASCVLDPCLSWLIKASRRECVSRSGQ